MPPTAKSPATPARETKTLHFKIKATGTTTVDGQEFGQIEAYGAAFNNVDEGNDRILPGAFTRTIQNSKARAKNRGKKYILKMLWQHDSNEIIGGWYDLKEDTVGVLAKGDIALATQRGREFYELAKAEMIDEFSIIYDIPSGGAKYDKSGVRDLTEIRLFSIDPVTFPMNDDPHTVAIKSKDNTMPDPPTSTKQRKTLQEHYNQGQAQDLLEDWQDLYICSLTKSIFDAFTIGDSPQGDISQALDDFKELVMGKFVSQAIECDLSQYIADSGYTYSPAASTLQNGSDDGSSGYGYMARHELLSTKKGAAISATNQSTIDDHVSNLHDIADKAMKSMKAAQVQMKAVHTAADDFANTIQGAEKPYADDDSGTPDTEQQEGKSRFELELERAMLGLKDLRSTRLL